MEATKEKIWTENSSNTEKTHQKQISRGFLGVTLSFWMLPVTICRKQIPIIIYWTDGSLITSENYKCLNAAIKLSCAMNTVIKQSQVKIMHQVITLVLWEIKINCGCFV